MTDLLREIWERWPAQIVALAAMSGFAWLAAPELTWINTDSDSAIYMASAKYLIPSHPTGAPFFNIMNAVWLRAFPFGSEAWRIALGSAIFSGATAGLLYKETKSLIAPMIYAGSAVVVSQSTILEAYALVTFCMVGIYAYRDKPKAVVAFSFVGLGVHHLIGLTLLPLMAHYFTHGKSLKPFLWLLLAPLMYLYVPLTAFDNSAWIDEITFTSLREYFSGQSGLILGLAIISPGPAVSVDLIERIQDFAIFFFGGFLAAIVPIFMRRKNDLLLWVFILPILHYGFGLPDLAWVYLMPSFAFGSIMAVEKLAQVDKASFRRTVGAFAAVAIVWNLAAFDIGKTLDPNLTAQAYYDDLTELPEGSFVFSEVRGWENIVLVLHNLDNNRGLKYERSGFFDQDTKTITDQLADAGINGKLFETVVVDASTYEVELRRVDPWEIWPKLIQKKYKFLDVPESEARFDWASTYYGKNGIPYPWRFESAQIDSS